LGVDCTVHHARLPMPFVRRGAWLNLAFDVAGIVKECFKVGASDYRRFPFVFF
jgi:hypothetical protein